MSQGVLIDVRQFVDEHELSPFQWRVLFLCFLVTTFDGLDTAALGFVAPALLQDFGVGRAALAPALSAALVGYAVGAMVAGPLADRIGRRRLVIGSVALFGFWCLASGWAASLDMLVVLRFLTGIGVGAAMPIVTALMSEFAPARIRSLMVTAMFCGFTLGSAGGGLLAAWIIPLVGWRGVLWLGGALPLIAVPLLVLWLPESPRYLLSVGAPARRIAAVLRKIAPAAVPADARFRQPDAARAASAPVVSLFRNGRGSGTALLWATFFLGLLVIYLLTTWLPTFVHDAGFTIGDAARIGALWQVGGTVGALVVAWAMDRADAHLAIAVAYALGAASVWATSLAGANLLSLGIGVTAAGFFISGAQTSMNALASIYYPTASRATGISWMLGIGRFGAIAGALCGNVLLGFAGSLDSTLALLAIPTAAASLLIFLKSQRAVRSEARRLPPGSGEGLPPPPPGSRRSTRAASHHREPSAGRH